MLKRETWARDLLSIAVVVVLLAGIGALVTGAAEGDGDGCARRNGERPGRAILRCTETSIAFVETVLGSGSGVVIERDGDRYVLTNEHVVSPFDAADVTVGGRTHEDVEVVGIDASADIAVLGPLSGTELPAPLDLGGEEALDRGDDVFLVGYPGEDDADDGEVTIASGIVSRRRAVREFGIEFIQTDAAIAGGQSGGPLFDDDARLVGISGLAFAEEFALALTAGDVLEAVDRILDGKGDDGLFLPGGDDTEGGATSGELRVFDAADGQVLFLPPSSEARTWRFSVDRRHRPLVAITETDEFGTLALSGDALAIVRQVAGELAAARGADVTPEQILESVGGLPDETPEVRRREVEPGTFEIPVAAGQAAEIWVSVPLTDEPVSVGWTSTLPLFPASQPRARGAHGGR